MINIRKAAEKDIEEVLYIEREAFGQDDESVLVDNLLKDPSAKPLLSLIACKNNKGIGHILFTNARLANNKKTLSVRILAPLAVIPIAQKKGIGGMLIDSGLDLLKKENVDLVFVLGHPDYYPRHGFEGALKKGFEAPYPIPDQYKDAWMVKDLRAEKNELVYGKIECADAMNKIAYWTA